MLLTFHKLRYHLFFLSSYRKTIINQSAREFSKIQEVCPLFLFNALVDMAVY